jgi:hypothetical protein
MGLSLRTEGWRYTAWVNYSYVPAEGGGVYGPIWEDMDGEELYNHTGSDLGEGVEGEDPGLSYNDPSEDTNLAYHPDLAAKKAELQQALKLGFPQRKGA